METSITRRFYIFSYTVSYNYSGHKYEFVSVQICNLYNFSLAYFFPRNLTACSLRMHLYYRPLPSHPHSQTWSVPSHCKRGITNSLQKKIMYLKHSKIFIQGKKELAQEHTRPRKRQKNDQEKIKIFSFFLVAFLVESVFS